MFSWRWYLSGGKSHPVTLLSAQDPLLPIQAACFHLYFCHEWGCPMTQGLLLVGTGWKWGRATTCLKAFSQATLSLVPAETTVQVWWTGTGGLHSKEGESRIHRFSKELFPICRLQFYCIGSVLCLTEAFQFHEVPFVNCWF